jgi:putative transposase
VTHHVHLLATPGRADGISKTFQSPGRRYAQYFNHACQRGGALWEGRYRATARRNAKKRKKRNGVRHD